MTEQEKTKADAAAYAVEIELLTRALMNLNVNAYFGDRAFSDGRAEIQRRLNVLLEMEGQS